MNDQKIAALRERIDVLNLEILSLLSERGRIAKEIGAIQTQRGSSNYDPKRELEMLKALVAANEGPFDDATLKSLFKSIFQASMDTAVSAEKPKFLTTRTADRPDTVVMVGDVPVGGDNSPILISGPVRH